MRRLSHFVLLDELASLRQHLGNLGDRIEQALIPGMLDDGGERDGTVELE